MISPCWLWNVNSTLEDAIFKSKSYSSEARICKLKPIKNLPQDNASPKTRLQPSMSQYRISIAL